MRDKQRCKAEDVVYLHHRSDEGKQQRKRYAGDDLGVSQRNIRNAHREAAKTRPHRVNAEGCAGAEDGCEYRGQKRNDNGV